MSLKLPALLIGIAITGCSGSHEYEQGRLKSPNAMPSFTAITCPEYALIGESIQLNVRAEDPEDQHPPQISWEISYDDLSLAQGVGSTMSFTGGKSGRHMVRCSTRDTAGASRTINRVITIELPSERDRRITEFLRGEWRLRGKGELFMILKLKDGGKLNLDSQSMASTDMGEIKGHWSVQNGELEYFVTGVENPFWNVLTNLFAPSDWGKPVRSSLELVDPDTANLLNADGTKETLQRIH